MKSGSSERESEQCLSGTVTGNFLTCFKPYMKSDSSERESEQCLSGTVTGNFLTCFKPYMKSDSSERERVSNVYQVQSLATFSHALNHI